MLWLSTWASFEDELIAMSEHGNKVLCEYRQKMVGKASGIAVESERYHVWTVEDGLVTRMAMFTIREEALADLG